MIDERAYLARLEAAGPDELARMLVRPSPDEERVLRAYLGDARYQRMHGMALRRSSIRAVSQPAGNVVVIHGIMGGELTAFDSSGAGDHIWAKFLRLAAGAVEQLRLDDSGLKELDPKFQVLATGIMKRHYGELLLSLGASWRVEAFWFDWRKDINLAAAELEARIAKWFPADAPVQLETGKSAKLPSRLPLQRTQASEEKIRGELEKAEDEEVRQLERQLYRTRTLRSNAESPGYVSPEERTAEEILTSGFLTTRFEEAPKVANPKADLPRPRIGIALVYGSLEKSHGLASRSLPVDAISVGHYRGGAYQHYGNPNFQFFASPSPADGEAPAKPRKAAAKKSSRKPS
jgi:hypothetical protein